ncbi:protease B [Fulvivirga imtechensis AK7]|uniref:Protease B n=1 Tax=Fulvivirga imtechensis AK7 TaxID=1237149 RepID=L8K215_9BACT|nr:M57 family metalloprotease [Fulvivirga imtechensis]ELR73502.1 protease B [Fulvivirga imtechensis AK7]
MKNLKLAAIAMAMVFLAACEQESVAPEKEPVSPETLNKLASLGFKTTDVFKYNGSLVVEGDIVIAESRLDEMRPANILAIEEQYHTDNLVTGMPRVIKVFVSTSFSSKYFNATDAAIARYNAEGLNLTFQRVTSSSGADIAIKPSPWWYGWFGILGSAGFPTASGNPHNEILLTRSYYDGVSDIGALTTTIAHEMGHCIGFRHTDYMDRSYSCGGSTSNEGDGGVGANHIPGTPTTGDPASWMLACSDGSDRPFNANDKTALDYLY